MELIANKNNRVDEHRHKSTRRTLLQRGRRRLSHNKGVNGCLTLISMGISESRGVPPPSVNKRWQQTSPSATSNKCSRLGGGDAALLAPQRSLYGYAEPKTMTEGEYAAGETNTKK